MISEALIEFLALKHAPPVHPDFVDCDDWHEFARAIEREAYKQGQEDMRERTASLCDRFQERQMQPAECAGAIRNLEIEEPK